MSKLTSDQNTEEIQLEQKLVGDLIIGDNDAWDDLYNRYHAKIVRFCGNYVFTLEESEDLAHDIFLKLKDKAKLFDVKKKLRPWLYSMARNHCLDYLRSRKLRQPKGELWSKCYFATTTRIVIPDQRSGPPTEMVKKDNHNELYSAIDMLSEDHRSVFLLKYADKLSRDEIAEALNIPLTTVKSRLFHSLKKMREIMQNE